MDTFVTTSCYKEYNGRTEEKKRSSLVHLWYEIFLGSFLEPYQKAFV